MAGGTGGMKSLNRGSSCIPLLLSCRIPPDAIMVAVVVAPVREGRRLPLPMGAPLLYRKIVNVSLPNEIWGQNG